MTRKNLWIGAAFLIVASLAINQFTGILSVVNPPKAAAQQTIPGNVTPIAITASGAAQSNAAILPGVAGKTTYITGFDLTGGGATGASVIEVSITGLPTAIGTMKFEVAILAGAAAPAFGTTGSASLMSIRFPTPIPATAVNSAITVTCPSFGSGNTNASVAAYGFQL